MPLEDLIGFGYEVHRTPEGVLPVQDSVVGHGKQWIFNPGQDEEALVLEAKNHAAIYTKMEQALQFFSDNYANWATMTAGQKDAANRQAQRGLANLIRHVRNDLTSEGD